MFGSLWVVKVLQRKGDGPFIRQERVEMVHKVLAPIKPTGGAIGIATIVAFAGAAACTQFLTLNMPFGGESGER